MIKQLTEIAHDLDGRGLVKEADYLDVMIKKYSGRLDWEEHETHPRALEMEGAEAAEAYEGSPEEGAEILGTEVSGALSLTWIKRGEMDRAKRDFGRKNEVVQLDEDGRAMMIDRDMAAMQGALDQDSGSEMGYFVMDPYNDEDFRKYVQRGEGHSEGKEVAVPLSTYEANGKRINFFKINMKGSEDKFGRVEEGAATEDLVDVGSKRERSTHDIIDIPEGFLDE